MTDHYFQAHPNSQHQIQTIHDTIGGINFSFKTDSGVFSKNRIDYGSKLLIETVLIDFSKDSGRVLELGSGYGPILISLAKHFPKMDFVGIEVNQRAYLLALENQKNNGLSNVTWQNLDVREFQSDANFDLVVTNPPIRAGKALIQEFMRIAYNSLLDSGVLYLVIQKKQGALSMKSFLESLFPKVEKIKQDKGYWILKAVKG